MAKLNCLLHLTEIILEIENLLLWNKKYELPGVIMKAGI